MFYPGLDLNLPSFFFLSWLTCVISEQTKIEWQNQHSTCIQPRGLYQYREHVNVNNREAISVRISKQDEYSRRRNG